MNNRARLTIVLAVLLVFVLSLAACEKDRPVPSSTSGTAQPQNGQVGTTPGPATTPGNVSSGTTSTAASPSATPPAGSSGAATPRPAATSTSPTKAAGQGDVYTVQLGDTLGAIAKQFGITAESIIEENSLTNPDVLMVGQELKIPGTQASSDNTASSESSGSTAEQTYVVTQGDTLGMIAKRFEVSVDELQELNEIADPNQISVGQTLRIPGSASSSSDSSSSTDTKTYVVQQGDTLFKIALRFGITLEALEEANNITNPNKVYPGQVLKIP